MDTFRITLFGVFIFYIVIAVAEAVDSECNFPAIYNFGDSNSDTGAISAAFLPIPAPYGELFFKKPAGRDCDGRLVIDFIGIIIFINIVLANCLMKCFTESFN